MITMSNLSREQLVDLLYYLGSTKVIDNGTSAWIRCCCPVHNEEHPSAGIKVDEKRDDC